jgi:hypothetical protein
MPVTGERGPQLPDEESVYRAIVSPAWWCEAENRPSTAAFDHQVFSVEVKSRTTPQQTAARFHDVTRLAEFNCGRARELEFNSHDERDERAPNNAAHAHVYFDHPPFPSNRTRKKHVKKLVLICTPIHVDPEAA